MWYFYSCRIINSCKLSIYWGWYSTLKGFNITPLSLLAVLQNKMVLLRLKICQLKTNYSSTLHSMSSFLILLECDFFFNNFTALTGWHKKACFHFKLIKNIVSIYSFNFLAQLLKSIFRLCKRFVSFVLLE